QFGRVLAVAGEPFLIGACYASRGAVEAFTVWLVAGPTDQGAHRRFRFLARGPHRRGPRFRLSMTGFDGGGPASLQVPPHSSYLGRTGDARHGAKTAVGYGNAGTRSVLM